MNRHTVCIAHLITYHISWEEAIGDQEMKLGTVVMATWSDHSMAVGRKRSLIGATRPQDLKLNTQMTHSFNTLWFDCLITYITESFALSIDWW